MGGSHGSWIPTANCRRVPDGRTPVVLANDSGPQARSTIGFAKIEFVWHGNAVAMKKSVILFGLLALGLVSGCLEKPGGKPVLPSGALVRAHFAGTDALAANTNTAKVQKILALPATAELREETLRKVAKAPVKLWRKELPPGAADQAASFIPLLADWLVAESYLEIRGPADRAEYALALQLDDERAKRWDTSLREISNGWKLGTAEPITIEIAQGWQLKKRQ